MSCKPVLLTMKINFDAAAIRWAMSPHFLLCIFGERFDIHFHFSIATPKFWCSSNQMSHVATIFFDARFHFKQKQLLMQLSWSRGPFINDVTLIWPGFDPIDYAVLEVLPLFFGHVKVTSPGPKWSVFWMAFKWPPFYPNIWKPDKMVRFLNGVWYPFQVIKCSAFRSPLDNWIPDIFAALIKMQKSCC